MHTKWPMTSIRVKIYTNIETLIKSYVQIIRIVNIKWKIIKMVIRMKKIGTYYIHNNNNNMQLVYYAHNVVFVSHLFSNNYYGFEINYGIFILIFYLIT